MKVENIKVGGWVSFRIGKDVHIGFITKIIRFDSKAQVAVPKISKTFTVNFRNLNDRESVNIRKEDIENLIDVALDARDFDWVKELSEQKAVI